MVLGDVGQAFIFGFGQKHREDRGIFSQIEEQNLLEILEALQVFL